MPGYVPGAGLAVKAISVFPASEPSHQGLLALFDEHDGRPLAVMDAARLTAIRTAAATAVSIRRLAREDAAVLAILGAGAQGRAHLEMLRDGFREVRVASRDPEHARELGNAAGSFEEAVAGADVVCCCTDADEPVVRHDQLARGTHLASVGFGAELDPEIPRRCRVFVEWRGAATEPYPAGAKDLAGVDAVTELGEVIAGTRPGRRSDEEITVYKSTGHAVEDVAAARLVYDRAMAEGAGQPLTA
jgi:alanine dehydrogenase